MTMVCAAGDQVSKKGGMTGGFYDYRRSKLKLLSIIRENAKLVHIKQQELAEVRAELQNLDFKCNSIVSEQEKLNATRSYHKSQADQLRTDIAALKKQESSTRQALEAKV